MVNSLGRKTYFVIIVIIAIVVVVGLSWWNLRANRLVNRPALPAATTPVAVESLLADRPLAVSLAQQLEIPWALDFLPDGSLIFTERPGRIRLLDAREGLLAEPLLTIDEVAHHGEGGLLGIAVHPDFVRNHFIYVYYTYQGRTNLANRVVRFRQEDRTLRDQKIIIDDIPAAAIHNGGRVRFGPDGMLYITTGDTGVAALAQDIDSLAGKILRLKDDGTIPPDNPFPASPVYSLGHRNPQGLAWGTQGRLWVVEHGSSATDELNLIKPGNNYGWPVIRGEGQADGMETPVLQSGQETWAPSGLTFSHGSLFFVGLRGQSLYQVVITDRTVVLQRHLEGKFGRLRDVVVGPDNMLYILTSNRDGRGLPTANDDQLIRVNPEQL